MKYWRIWLLLLLAVLLPVRGAVAAAMLCPVAGPGTQSELVLNGHPAGHAAFDDATSHDHAGPHTHSSAGHDGGHAGHDHNGSDKCNLCSSYCSLTLLVSHAPTAPEPLALIAVKFADYTAPPPSFVSGGQERPPRTI